MAYIISTWWRWDAGPCSTVRRHCAYFAYDSLYRAFYSAAAAQGKLDTRAAWRVRDRLLAAEDRSATHVGLRIGDAVVTLRKTR